MYLFLGSVDVVATDEVEEALEFRKPSIAIVPRTDPHSGREHPLTCSRALHNRKLNQVD